MERKYQPSLWKQLQENRPLFFALIGILFFVLCALSINVLSNLESVKTLFQEVGLLPAPTPTSTLSPTLTSTPTYTPTPNIEYWSELGRGYKRQENYEQAIFAYSQALALDPYDDGNLFQRADMYQELGRFEEAIADYTAIIVLFPRDPLAYIFRAYNYMQLGKFEEAIVDYNFLIEINHLVPRTLFERGRAYYEINKFEMAISDFEQFLATCSSGTICQRANENIKELERLLESGEDKSPYEWLDYYSSLSIE